MKRFRIIIFNISDIFQIDIIQIFKYYFLNYFICKIKKCWRYIKVQDFFCNSLNFTFLKHEWEFFLIRTSRGIQFLSGAPRPNMSLIGHLQPFRTHLHQSSQILAFFRSGAETGGMFRVLATPPVDKPGGTRTPQLQRVPMGSRKDWIHIRPSRKKPAPDPTFKQKLDPTL